jgi:formate C-acetyltransferase
VTRWPTPTGKPFWPALYNHLFNDFAKTVGATPDGRRWGDPIGEHYSPAPGKATNGPTAVINSAVKGPLAEACGSSIFHVSLSRSMAPMNDEGRLLLRSLIDGALKQGIAVMNTAIYDVSVLREARENPEMHQDLVVRVWGYSARFVDLCEDMQDHIIQRAVPTGE